MSFDIKSGRHPLGVGFCGVGINHQDNDYLGPPPASACINHHQDQKGEEAHRDIAPELVSSNPLPLDAWVPSALSLKAINFPTACSALGLEKLSRFDSPFTPLCTLKKSQSQNEGPSISLSFAIPASPTEEHVPQCPVSFVNATSPKEGNSPRCFMSLPAWAVVPPAVYQPTDRKTFCAFTPEPTPRHLTRSRRESQAKATEKCLSPLKLPSIVPSAYTSDTSDSLFASSATATMSSMVSNSSSPISGRFSSMRASTQSHSSLHAPSTCSDHKSVGSDSRALLHFPSLESHRPTSPHQFSWHHSGVAGGVMNPNNLLKVGEKIHLQGFQAPTYYDDYVSDKNTKSSATVTNQRHPQPPNVVLSRTQDGIHEFIDRMAMKTRNATEKRLGPKNLMSVSDENIRANRGSSSIPSRSGSFEPMARRRVTFIDKPPIPTVCRESREESDEQAILHLHQIAGEVLTRAHSEILDNNRAFVNDLRLPKLAMCDLQSGSSKPHLKEPAGYVHGATSADVLEDFSKNHPRQRKLSIISFSKFKKEKSNRDPGTWTTESSTSGSCCTLRSKSRNILNSLYRSARNWKISQA